MFNIFEVFDVRWEDEFIFVEFFFEGFYFVGPVNPVAYFLYVIGVNKFFSHRLVCVDIKEMEYFANTSGE